MRMQERWKMSAACAMALAVVVVFGTVSQYVMLRPHPAVVCK